MQYIEIFLGILVILVALLGFVWGKWTKAKTCLKETAEALTTLSEAIEDNDLTKEELQSITKEFQDVITSAMELLSRGK